MEIKSFITKEHYQEFLKYSFKNATKKGKIKWLYQAYGFFFYMYIVTSVLFIYEANKYAQNVYVYSLINVFWISIAALVAWIILSSIFNKKVTTTNLSNNGTTLGQFTYVLSDNGIKETSEKHTFECSWNAITEVTRTPNLILFSLEPFKGIMIHVNDDELAENIIEFSERKINNKNNLIV